MIKHDDELGKSIVRGDENQALSHLERCFTVRNGSDCEGSDCRGAAGTARAPKACPEMAIQTLMALLDTGALFADRIAAVKWRIIAAWRGRCECNLPKEADTAIVLFGIPDPSGVERFQWILCQ